MINTCPDIRLFKLRYTKGIEEALHHDVWISLKVTLYKSVLDTSKITLQTFTFLMS